MFKRPDHTAFERLAYEEMVRILTFMEGKEFKSAGNVPPRGEVHGVKWVGADVSGSIEAEHLDLSEHPIYIHPASSVPSATTRPRLSSKHFQVQFNRSIHGCCYQIDFFTEPLSEDQADV